MSVENRDPVVHLDRGFWLVTAFLVVLSAIAVVATLMIPTEKIMGLPEAAIPADQVDALVKFLTASSAVIFILVIGYLLYFSFAFRRRASDAPDAVGVQIHDSHKLELWWTLIPTVFIVILAFFSVKIWAGVNFQPESGLVVESIGHQWFYDFRYPGVHGMVTDEMHLPPHVAVTLHVTSSDVIHSFWIPAMRIKADMVPGMINTLRFTPTEPGTYKIICTEFCGTQHAVMQKQIVVVDASQAAFDTWLAGWKKKNANASDALPTMSTSVVKLDGGDAAAGKTLFAAKCSACHAMAEFNKRIVGPGLMKLMDDPAHPKLVNGDAASPENVAKLIQKGYTGDMGHMPSEAENAITDKDIANVVAYLKSMK
ncbi:MAG: cytochrome c oxidase subunit II [Candidatus Eremiobacteraeota bacterium]|nr:cytochrome c oxidase subunit II [Candidatus Eremiobacteraeota bacterium]